MPAAAIQASFADWKLVKTRAVVQLIFEIPVEQSDLAYKVVGGMPDAAKERWFAIARLQENGTGSETFRASPASSREAETVNNSGPASRSWHEMLPAQQAGLLCNAASFHKFLQEMCVETWNRYASFDPTSRAANSVRRLCEVSSRASIIHDTHAGMKWAELVKMYRAWMREPEYVA